MGARFVSSTDLAWVQIFLDTHSANDKNSRAKPVCARLDAFVRRFCFLHFFQTIRPEMTDIVIKCGLAFVTSVDGGECETLSLIIGRGVWIRGHQFSVVAPLFPSYRIE